MRFRVYIINIGGQYTNLLFQAQSLGLGNLWQEIKQNYVLANRILGDIPKVTPSSKVVGDLAQFITQNELSEKELLEKAGSLSFPQSVLEYLQGYLGEPPYGYLEPFRTDVLESRNLSKVTERQGKSLVPLDLEALFLDLEHKYGSRAQNKITEYDVLSAALYPKVFDEFMTNLETYGDLSTLPTRFFLTPMKVGQEISYSIELGKKLIIQFVAIGRLNEETRKRDVFFLLNGESRIVSVLDQEKGSESSSKQNKAVSLKADKNDKTQIGAPMSGSVIDVRVKVGDVVKSGDALIVVSAMKMESVCNATVAGVVGELFVKVASQIEGGDLMARIIP